MTQITFDELLQMIGEQAVRIRLLERRLAELEPETTTEATDG